MGKFIIRFFILLGLIFSALTAMAATVVPLNDTGLTLCNSGTGSCISGTDDGHYGRDAANVAGQLTKIGAGNAGFDFTKIANNGSALAASAVLGNNPADWACTRDNVTGLIWEVKTTSGLRSTTNTYTWSSTDSASNGGNVGTANGGVCTGSNCDTQSFVAAVNAAVLCGYTDWRMPRQSELLSLLDLSGSLPNIDANYFPNTQYSYWIADTHASAAAGAWAKIGNFGSGVFSGGNKSGKWYVRLVRGVQ